MTKKNKNRGGNGGGNITGLKDVNPQYLNMPILQQTAINTVVENKVSTPVVGIVSNDKAIVMEILKVFLFTDPVDVAVAYVSIGVSLNKKSKGTTAFPAFNDSDVIAQDIKGIRTLANGQCAVPDQTRMIDLTDGAGNGYLFAGKEIWLQMVTGNSAAGQTKAATGKVLYRLKIVSALEFAGMQNE